MIKKGKEKALEMYAIHPDSASANSKQVLFTAFLLDNNFYDLAKLNVSFYYGWINNNKKLSLQLASLYKIFEKINTKQPPSSE